VADHRQAAGGTAGLSPPGSAAGRHETRTVALVTGARRGIGRGIAWALADAGFDLALCDLARDADAEATEAGVGERGARCVFHATDVAELGGHAALLAAARALSGRLDCLVNDAGLPAALRLADADIVTWEVRPGIVRTPMTEPVAPRRARCRS
jgi:NADP-dependent 3-hydroxy acid dehydrogenase YdfG